MYRDFNGKIWYKGNLHTHTSRSDGSLSVEQTVARYRHAGYDFLSLTDHNLFSETVEEPDFLLLAGTEYDFYSTQDCHGQLREVCVHINGIGYETTQGLGEEPGRSAQDVVNAIHRAGGIAIFNHPAWSRNLPEDAWTIQGLDGVEIFNSVADCQFQKNGYSGAFVDNLALTGRMLPVFATDDSHFYTGEECVGFTMVQSDSLSRADVLRAIRERRFFASQGPWVQAWEDNHTVHIACTPVQHIRILSNVVGAVGFGGTRLTGAHHTLPDAAYYYRVEVMDENGNWAWTSPKSLK